MTKTHLRLMFALFGAAMIVAACAGQPSEPAATDGAAQQAPQEPVELTVMTHDSFAVSEEVIAEFEAANNATVNFLLSGDAGSALNQAILSKENPLADVFFGVDNTFLTRALDEDIFEPYRSPALERVPDAFELDPQARAVPIDYGDVCLNYDKAYFEASQLDPPDSLEDLIDPAYSGLTVVENPATSSPGLAFLLATVGHFGEDGYLDFWSALRENDVLVSDGWEDAYYGQFSGGASSEGERPIVVSYASSPAAEVYFADEPIDEPPTGNVLSAGSCFRQIEFAGILKGTPNRPLAEKFIDFMLSQPFQEDIPTQMFVFPVSDDATLPDFFVQYAPTPDQPAEVSPERIAEMRDTWIEQWTETVLR